MINKRILSLLLYCILFFCLFGCSSGEQDSDNKLGNGWVPSGSLPLQYATQFEVDYYDGGYSLISVSDGSKFLVVPENAPVPDGVSKNITVLQQPIDNVYLVATASMCLFDALESLDCISLSGTKSEDWYLQNARTSMENGEIIYAGKYSAPDYELILSSGCRLAIESTMITHTPEVKKKLEELGVSVIVDQSSYEKHPLGRTEWMKLYAVLVGKEALAESLFREQTQLLEAVLGLESTGKTVAFFYMSPSGYAVARKSGDYVTKMIELAGGEYIFQNLGDSETATSTVNLEMESFYATARDADFIIYNSTVAGGLTSMEEFLGINTLLADFKAVKEGNVWCTGKNMFQETTQLGLMISDIHEMLCDDGTLAQLNFMYKLT